MRKILLSILTFLFMINFNNVDAAEQSHYCEYNYDGAKLVIYETGSNQIGYILNTDNATSTTYVRTPSREEIKNINSFNAEVSSTHFFDNSGNFKCGDIEITKQYHTPWWSVSPDGMIVTFTSALGNHEIGNEGYYDTLKAPAMGEYNRYCNYRYSSDDKQFMLHAYVGAGKIEYSFPLSDAEINEAAVNEDIFFDSNGIFRCENVELSAKYCMRVARTGTIGGKKSGDVIYFTSPGNINNLCVNDNEFMYTDIYSYGPTDRLSESDAEDPKYEFQQGDLDCDGIFAGDFGRLLKSALNIIKFAVPILIIILSIMDFIKAIAAQDAKEIKNASNKLMKRVIIGIIIFVLPTIIDVAFDLAGIPYGTCGINKN